MNWKKASHIFLSTVLLLAVTVLDCPCANALNIDYEKSRARIDTDMPQSADEAVDYLTGVMRAEDASVYDRVAAYRKILELGGWLFDGAMVVNGDFEPAEEDEKTLFGTFPDVMAWFEESRLRCSGVLRSADNAA